jgi:CRISPR/Cas system CSM-associated protein Csm4 (group 5 of RAMP superfamily)
MKSFKAFIQLDELEAIKLKAKKEQEFVKSTYLAQTKDPDDLEKVGPKEVGSKDLKLGQGKRLADRLDNKQSFGEENKMKTYRTMKKSMKEAEFTKQQTKMAHTIGKEFEKKGVGDDSKGGPYAIASSMVRDNPDAAQKAYNTIKLKMKEDADTEILFKLFKDLNEDNQEFFMIKLEENADDLLSFARKMVNQNG